jgi:hypothetical protein
MQPRSALRASLVVAATIAATTLITVPAAQAAGTAQVTYAGGAWGSMAHLGPVSSGQTAVVGLCTGQVGVTNTNATASVTLPDVGTIGAVKTRTSSLLDGTFPESYTTSKTEATTLLDGAIHADVISATARLEFDGHNYLPAGHTTFVGLTINGQRISAQPAPDTVIAIPGVGRVVLNHQQTDFAYGLRSFTVTAMRLIVLPNNSQGRPAGSVVIGNATAALHSPTFARPYGEAYGSTIVVDHLARSGRTALVQLPCGGSNGATLKNNIASISEPGTLVTGTVATSATSTDTATKTTASTHSRIENVQLLGGLVTAGVITTSANAVRQGNSLTFPATGTTFVRLRVNGHAISGTPRLNSSFTIPGVGTLHANVVVQSGTGIQAYGLQLVLTAAQGGLPIGAVITISAASAGVSAR